MGIPTPQFTGEEEQSLNTIQENMVVDNNLYVVVHTASDYVSSEQMEKEFVSSFILGHVMNCVYIVKAEAIQYFWGQCKQIILYLATKEMGAIL